MRLRLLPVTAAVIVVLLAAYGAAWPLIADRIAAAISQWAAERTDSGYPTHFSALSMSGFPLRFRATIEAADMTLEGSLSQMRWQGDRAIASIRPWAPRRPSFRLEGEQRFLDKNGLLATLTAADARARLTLNAENRVAGIAAVAHNIRLGLGPLAEPFSIARIELAFPAERAAEDSADGASFRLDMEKIDLPAGRRLPAEQGGALGQRIDRLLIVASVTGPLPDATSEAALAAWRDAGGTVEIRQAELRWGPLILGVSGTAALDDQMRPVAAFTARIQNYDIVLDAFAANGTMRQRDAAIAKTLFRLLAKPGENGAPPVLEIPLTIQDGLLSAGPVPLLKVPPLRPFQTRIAG